MDTLHRGALTVIGHLDNNSGRRGWNKCLALTSALLLGPNLWFCHRVCANEFLNLCSTEPLITRNALHIVVFWVVLQYFFFSLFFLKCELALLFIKSCLLLKATEIKKTLGWLWMCSLLTIEQLLKGSRAFVHLGYDLTN